MVFLDPADSRYQKLRRVKLEARGCQTARVAARVREVPWGAACGVWPPRATAGGHPHAQLPVAVSAHPAQELRCRDTARLLRGRAHHVPPPPLAGHWWPSRCSHLLLTGLRELWQASGQTPTSGRCLVSTLLPEAPGSPSQGEPGHHRDPDREPSALAETGLRAGCLVWSGCRC